MIKRGLVSNATKHKWQVAALPRLIQSSVREIGRQCSSIPNNNARNFTTINRNKVTSTPIFTTIQQQLHLSNTTPSSSPTTPVRFYSFRASKPLYQYRYKFPQVAKPTTTATTNTTATAPQYNQQQQQQQQSAPAPAPVQPKQPAAYDNVQSNLSSETALAVFKDVLAHSPAANALLSEPALIISRELQWGTIIAGFEQANQYTLRNQNGEIVGLIAEEDSLGKGIMRNITHTHRSFTATIMDPQGNIIMRIRRPFYFINSTLYLEDPKGNVIGEIQQRYHVWRRKYDLYLGKEQFSRIDAPVLSWDFEMLDYHGNTVATVNKDFTGFARTIFTDANQYVVRLNDQAENNNSKPLTLDQRAVALGCAVAVDFDYFSHLSGGPGLLGWLPIPLPMPAPEPAPVPAEAGAEASAGAGDAAGAAAGSAAAGAVGPEFGGTPSGVQYGGDEADFARDLEQDPNQVGEGWGVEAPGQGMMDDVNDGEDDEEGGGGGIFSTLRGIFGDDD